MRSLAIVVLVTGCTLAESSQPVAPDSASTTDPPASCHDAPWPLYINRFGGSYTPAAEPNASINATNILREPRTVPSLTTATLPEWNSFIACLENKFARFNVEITERDPGDQPHIELAVMDHGESIGISFDVVFAAPMFCRGDDSGTIPMFRGVAFLMWESAGAQDACWRGAQALAQTVGVEQVDDALDLMSNTRSSDKQFRDAMVACADGVCACNPFGMENTNRKLGELFGPRCR